MVRRVLFLTNALDLFGAAVSMRLLAEGLRKDFGIEVAVASFRVDGTYDAAWYEAGGLRVFQVEGMGPCYVHPFSYKTWWEVWRALRSIDRVIRDFNPDVIHAHSGRMAATAWFLRWRLRAPIVNSIMGDAQPRAQITFAKWASRLLPKPHGDLCIAISAEMIEFLVGLGIPRASIRRVLAAADDTHFRPATPLERGAARQRFGIAPDASVVALVGQYHPRKGHDVLLEAVALLAARGRPVTMLCAGESFTAESVKSALRARANAAAIGGRLILREFEDARDVFWASDVAVLPSRLEGFGLVVAEAMLCGVVPIRTPAAGARDTVIDGETGFLVPFEDPRALADRIEQLITDDVRRVAMAEAALRYARAEFTVARMVRQTLAVYEEARAPRTVAAETGDRLYTKV